MSELLAALQSPETLSQEQWLVIAIVGFISLGSIYFVLRLYRIIQNASKTKYKPNIGLSRTGYKPPPTTKSE